VEVVERLREAEEGELGQILKLANQVFREDSGFKPSLQDEFPLVFNTGNLHNLILFSENGLVVSFLALVKNDAIIMRCPIGVGSVTYVCTRPGYRGRGLATALVREAEERHRRNGCDIMTIGGGWDTLPYTFYGRIGYVPVGKMLNFVVNKEDALGLQNGKVEVAPYKRVDLPQVSGAYRKEPVRYFRCLDDFTTLLDVGSRITQYGLNQDVLVVRRGGMFAAYLVLRVYEETGEKKADLYEYAGARSAILAAIPHVFQRYQLSEMQFCLLPHDTEMTEGLKGVCKRSRVVSLAVPRHPYSKGLVESMAGIQLKVLNFQQLMLKLRPYFEEQLGGTEASSLKTWASQDEYSFEHKGEILTFQGEADLAKLMFADGAARLEGEGKLNKVLRRIFPIPLPWPGLNYA